MGQVSCCNGHIPDHDGGESSPVCTGRSLPTLLVSPASPGNGEKARLEKTPRGTERSPRSELVELGPRLQEHSPQASVGYYAGRMMDVQEARNDVMTALGEADEAAELSTSTEIGCQADSEMAQSSSMVEDTRSAKTAMRMKARSEAQVKVRSFLRAYGFRGIREQRRPQRYLGTYSCPPLHDAVRKRDPRLVKLLLIAGADPFQADSSGRTPLRYAEQQKAPEQILYLLTAATRDGKRWVPWPRFKGSSDSLGSLSSCDMQSVTSA